MIIRRKQSWWHDKLETSRPFTILSILLLTISCVSSAQGRFNLLPGVRGPHLTIALDAPEPFEASLSTSQAQGGAFDSDDPSLDQPVPFPELGDISQYGFSATPNATSSSTPFVAPTRFDPGLAAAPFAMASRNPVDSLRAAICLTTAIYYEAVSESDDGQRAVAQVILNRVKHPAWPNTVCGVVYQGSDGPVCQFSYACDGSMARVPTREGWTRASRIARAALAGYVHRAVGLSTFYHADYVNPLWNRRLIVANVTGRHIFYRMPGTVGAPQTFYASYRGLEPTPAPKPRAYVAAAPMVPGNVPLPPNVGTRPATPGASVPYPGAIVGAAASPSPQVAAQSSVPLPKPDRSGVRNDDRYVSGSLPESDVLPQYRNSGQWIGK